MCLATTLQVTISFDETTRESHIDDLFRVFAEAFPGTASHYNARTIAASLPPVAGIPTAPEDAEVFSRAPQHGPTSYKKWGPLSLREWDPPEVAALADTVERFRPSGRSVFFHDGVLISLIKAAAV